MKLSIIIPVLNERDHIDGLIASITHLDEISKEILIVDGGSKDGTREKVLELGRGNSAIRLVDNPDLFVSQGFNRAFKEARGRYIALIGAHALYPLNYFYACVEAIESGVCDSAGGVLVQSGRTLMGRAIAQAMSSRFGVGDTAFRTSRKRGYVDSVAFAVYDRYIFEKVGVLDEELIRNQDDEFHYRLNAAGFRMLMLPELEVVYYVRDSLRKLFSQYYQYGYYKPLVIRKVRTGLRLRHLIPSFFVLYLFSLPVAFLVPLWILPLVFYLLFSVFFSLGSQAPLSVRWRMLLVFPTLHIAYGSGFLIGLPRSWRR